MVLEADSLLVIVGLRFNWNRIETDLARIATVFISDWNWGQIGDCSAPLGIFEEEWGYYGRKRFKKFCPHMWIGIGDSGPRITESSRDARFKRRKYFTWTEIFSSDNRICTFYDLSGLVTK